MMYKSKHKKYQDFISKNMTKKEIFSLQEADIYYFREALNKAKKIGCEDVENKKITYKLVRLAEEIYLEEETVKTYYFGRGKKNSSIPKSAKKFIELALHMEGEIFFTPLFDDTISESESFINVLIGGFDNLFVNTRQVLYKRFFEFEKCPAHIWDFINRLTSENEIDYQKLVNSHVNAFDTNLSCKVQMLELFIALRKAIHIDETNNQKGIDSQHKNSKLSKKIDQVIESKGYRTFELFPLISSFLIPLLKLCGLTDKNWEFLLAYINLGVEENISEQQKAIIETLQE